MSASTSSGVIRDADIEVNAFHFNWADLVAHPDLRGNGQPYHDLQNALTHEMGHLIGLDHTCYFQGPPPIDNTGAPITDCASASAEVLETTMFPSANPGDVDKRTLAPDDQLAVCEIYPAAEDPMTCAPAAPPEEGCSSCAVGGAPASAVGLICWVDRGGAARGARAAEAPRLTPLRRTAAIARLSLLTAAVFAMTGATPAWGYVRKKTDGGIDRVLAAELHPADRLPERLHGHDARRGRQVDRRRGAHLEPVRGDAAPTASRIRFSRSSRRWRPTDAIPPTPAYDGRNTLLFYTPSRPYPPFEISGIAISTVALTSTWARADGHIVDADVRINAVDNFFANIDPGFIATNGQFPFDLQNAVTHEFGHLIGLGHSCWNLFSDTEQPIDDMGVPVPTCDTAPDDVVQTVMFATIQANLETSKRVLSPDDIRAACSIYPSTQDPHVCAYDTPNEGCGCRTSPTPGGYVAIALLSVLALLALAAGGRRRRLARPPSR